MFELSSHLFSLSIAGAAVALLLLPVLLGAWLIGEQESGLVIKRFGRALPDGRLLALDGEAGYQARLLPPGLHLFLWRWQYKVLRVPNLVVQPGEIALVVAADGAPIPSSRILGREVPCNDFQDAEAFLRRGGERGRQLGFLRAGTYRINPALFEVIAARDAIQHGIEPQQLRVLHIAPNRVGIVTTLDGQPIGSGDVAGPLILGHDSFQCGQAFMDAGGRRGLQEQVLLSGAWNLNPWFVHVEESPMTEVPIGCVGVVVSYVGNGHLDVSGAAFKHGDLVKPGHKGVWVEPLLPGKHPINVRIMKVELVPTTNIVLNWAARSEAHKYDDRLSSILVRSKDGFSFAIDVSQIIHISAKEAPRVISRVGSVQNLVDHVLQPIVGNYFRNSAQEFTVLDFLSARSERQRMAFQAIKAALSAYDVECIDTLIGDIAPPAELMKTQTERKIADESRRTYEVQREAQIKRQDLERETAIANLQAEVVRSEQAVRIATQQALAEAEHARGAAQARRLSAEAEAQATRLSADAEADATRARSEAEAVGIRATGAAKAEAYRQGIEALGASGYTALQIATSLGEHHVKLVPDIAVGSAGGSGMLEALTARLLSGGLLPVGKS